MTKPCVFIVQLLLIMACVPTLSGEDFSTKVVDGLKRPLFGALVEVIWHETREDFTTGREVGRLEMRSDDNGIVRGSFDEKSLAGKVVMCIRLSKPGYRDIGPCLDPFRLLEHGLTVVHAGPCQSEYALRRIFHETDISRIAMLPDKARARALKEVLAGDLKRETLIRAIFKMDRAFRPVLRELLQDRDSDIEASCLLAFIGVPEDLQLIAEHTPASRKDRLDDFWTVDVVSAMLEPATEKQWKSLKEWASGNDDFDLPMLAVLTLKLIASPRSRQILEDVRANDEELASFTKEAIAYIASKPAPLSDRNLVELGKRAAAAVNFGHWRENQPPEYNETRDKALIEMGFVQENETLP